MKKPDYRKRWQVFILFLKKNVQKFELIVVSDGSSDHTPEIVRAFAKNRLELSLIEYKKNRGKGYAVRAGLKKARGEWLVYLDADHSTNIRELEQLPDLIDGGGDIFVSSRYLAESRVKVKQPWGRIFLSRIANGFLRALLPGVRDTQNGFKILSRRTAGLLNQLKVDGWLFDVELLYLAKYQGFKIVEFPVTWKNSELTKLRSLKAWVRSAIEFVQILVRSPWQRRALAKGHANVIE